MQMRKPDDEMPEPNRSLSEIEFVLRHAKKRSGPEMLRDVARAEEEKLLARARPLSTKRGSDPF